MVLKVLKGAGGILKENWRMRRANWKGAWNSLKYDSMMSAMTGYFEGLGQANRHLIGMGRR